MNNCKTVTFGRMAVLMACIVLIACSGGGGGSGAPDSAAPPGLNTSPGPGMLQVDPPAHDFGVVTDGNVPAPLRLKITNVGGATLPVRDLVLSDVVNFRLNPGAETNSCGTGSPTLGPGATCTLEVAFQPTNFGSYESVLTVTPGEPVTPVATVQISGTFEAEAELKVRINQVETDSKCPGAEVTAYVSVTDQGGYPVIGLSEANFSIFENMSQVDFSRPPVFVSQVHAPISVALALDYSKSITDTPEYVADMEAAAADFIHHLGAGDEAEIIKFGTEVEVFQEFTSDKALLLTALQTPWVKEGKTNLYDAVQRAVQDTAPRKNSRKAVIVITDGENRGDQTRYSLKTVIQYAGKKGIPVFTVGLGLFDSGILETLADGTGGQFYRAATSDNLENTYLQLVDTLLQYQYVLSYVSHITDGASADLRVKTVSQTIAGEDTRRITPCP
ncbi:VWA domain-containing protein [Desulfococcus sp.]|uniref:VWA domain-containing protein n=1 Tax=Desulfococcus sp. TaxID=2025834 RepID=UPI00359441AE